MVWLLLNKLRPFLDKWLVDSSARQQYFQRALLLQFLLRSLQSSWLSWIQSCVRLDFSITGCDFNLPFNLRSSAVHRFWIFIPLPEVQLRYSFPLLFPLNLWLFNRCLMCNGLSLPAHLPEVIVDWLILHVVNESVSSFRTVHSLLKDDSLLKLIHHVHFLILLFLPFCFILLFRLFRCRLGGSECRWRW